MLRCHALLLPAVAIWLAAKSMQQHGDDSCSGMRNPNPDVRLPEVADGENASTGGSSCVVGHIQMQRAR